MIGEHPATAVLRARSRTAWHAALVADLRAGEADWLRDSRDLMVALAPYRDCAARLGMAVGWAFRAAAWRGPAGVRSTVVAFGKRRDVTLAATLPGCDDRTVSLDAWRQNFDEPDDRRLVRLGELVEPIVASGESATLRAGLATVLLARLEATPPADDRTHEWATSGELLADERAWAAEGQADDAEYLRCFQEARAFGAVREVTEDADDGDAVAAAIYELFHSLGASPSAVFDVLSQAPEPWAALARDAGRR